MAELPRDGCDLESDITRPDDKDPATGRHVGAYSFDVVDASQVVDPGEIATGGVDTPDPRPERENEFVVTDRSARIRCECTGLPIDRRKPGIQPNVDRGVVVKGGRLDVKTLRRHLAGQELLRERRPLVRQPALFTQQYDLAVESFLPERCNSLSGRMAGARDDDSLGHACAPR